MYIYIYIFKLTHSRCPVHLSDSCQPYTIVFRYIDVCHCTYTQRSARGANRICACDRFPV